MRTIIDLTDDATYPEGDEMPPSLLRDDGETVLVLGGVEIRMTYLQFDRLHTAMTAWMTREAAQAEFSIEPPEDEPEPPTPPAPPRQPRRKRAT